jgi:hypothetical protein
MPRLTARTIDQLPAWFWVGVLVAAAFLTVDTAMIIQRVGLVGERPPLSIFQTGVRIVLGMSSLGLMLVRRDLFERITLLSCAAAAGSSTLYGFGLRSPGLSAFRLVSHVVMYVLVMMVAGRMISRARPLDRQPVKR